MVSLFSYVFIIADRGEVEGEEEGGCLVMAWCLECVIVRGRARSLYNSGQRKHKPPAAASSITDLSFILR